MKKAIIVLIIGIIFYTGYKGFQKTESIPKRDLSEVNLDQKMLIEDILKESIKEINKKMENDDDLSSGPCILNPSTIDSDWVVDMVHDPKIEADDEKANQCSNYTEGLSKHFIEVDDKGKLLRFI